MDFGKIHASSSLQPADSVLRVAVAAMTSPQETFQSYHRLVDHLGRRLGRRIQLVQRRTYAEVNDLLLQGELDLAFICTGAWVDLEPSGRVTLLAVPRIRGETTYRSYLVVPAASPWQGLADLGGARFAFTDSLSLTGCWHPRAQLAKLGTTPEAFFAATLYTHGHDRSLRAVADGMVDAACVDGLIFDYLRERRPALVAGLRVAERSTPFGMPPLVAPVTLDSALKAGLESVLFSMHEDREGQGLLDSLLIELFLPPPDSLYHSVRGLRQHRLHP